MANGYDLIGDIHGHADALEALLSKMDYVRGDGSYRHPDGRQVIFLGDLIDGGRDNRRVLAIARDMVATGEALAMLGNHEYNAICWHTRDPNRSGEWLRTHSAEKQRQHQATLDEFADDTHALAEMIGWFRTLPLFIDLGELRVVHACWHESLIDSARRRLGETAAMDEAFLVESAEKNTSAYEIVETLLKGMESTLPEGVSFLDKYGNERNEARIRWWRYSADTLEELVIGNAEIYRATRGQPADPGLIHGYDESDPPVFFGHYWLTGAPMLQAPNVACLDYSVSRGGRLVAYRWNGEHTLDATQFVC